MEHPDTILRIGLGMGAERGGGGQEEAFWKLIIYTFHWILFNVNFYLHPGLPLSLNKVILIEHPV